METVGSTRALLKYDCLLFDMDDTLYPMSAGLNYACRKNIEEFMLTYLNIEESQVSDMCLDLYREHGTTMAGLKALGYKFDDDAYHAFVHGTLPYLALKPDLVLRNLLLSMPQRKIIFTNADKAHAARVLSRLGLEDCFEGVICFETLNSHPIKELENQNDCGMNNYSDESSTRIICKPALESFQAATVIANLDPKKTSQKLVSHPTSDQFCDKNGFATDTVTKKPLNLWPEMQLSLFATDLRLRYLIHFLPIFFDDSTRNIATAKTAGFHTIIVGRSSLVPGADHALNNIHNLREALPELWEDVGEHLEQVFFQSAVETVVNA